jgi:hypothetical protein
MVMRDEVAVAGAGARPVAVPATRVGYRPRPRLEWPVEPMDVGEVGESRVRRGRGVRDRWRVDPALRDQPYSGRAALPSPFERLVGELDTTADREAAALRVHAIQRMSPSPTMTAAIRREIEDWLTGSAWTSHLPAERSRTTGRAAVPSPGGVRTNVIRGRTPTVGVARSVLLQPQTTVKARRIVLNSGGFKGEAMRGPYSRALGSVPVQAQEGECSRVGSLWGKGPTREHRTHPRRCPPAGAAPSARSTR